MLTKWITPILAVGAVLTLVFNNGWLGLIAPEPERSANPNRMVVRYALISIRGAEPSISSGIDLLARISWHPFLELITSSRLI